MIRLSASGRKQEELRVTKPVNVDMFLSPESRPQPIPRELGTLEALHKNLVHGIHHDVSG